ncbi:hypothetical protein TCAL_12324 [Tigriopus californicus]|uniref:CUB domain-containing protein n=1 Tax=Tigriopus californicus TaxID=6832 RepID=A0A553PSL6_TIGCA|nr:hypothetical protein TCAL_12324 [Tigriopus californicus]
MNFRTCLVFLALICVQARENNVTKSSRKAKLFSLFNVVRFDNGVCSGLATTGGFVISSSTGGTVTQNGTSIQAPMNQGALTDGMSISYQVNRQSSDVCFLRLDFETFNILGPMDTNEVMGGACVDTFTATTGTGMETICGLNTGEHIFVEFGSNFLSTFQFTFGNTPGGTNAVRDWDIKVDQIPCTGPTSPRDGCLQYHLTNSGMIKTFNFDGTTGHLANQRYSACIRQNEGFCCVEYQVCPPPIMNPFVIDDAVNLLEENNCGITTNDKDFVIIAGASATCSMEPGTLLRSKFCGSTFNFLASAPESAPVCDCSPPFGVGFITDDAAPGTATKVPQGVCLTFRQIPC